MSKTNLQFHAMPEDICKFINTLLQDKQYTACGVFLFPDFAAKSITDELTIDDIAKYDMVVILTQEIQYSDNYRDFIRCQDNNLGITIGHEADGKLEESSMWVFAEHEIVQVWKTIIGRFKRSLLKGAWVVNPTSGDRGFYKDIRFTVNAKRAYENGMEICPIAGWNRYELIGEQGAESQTLLESKGQCLREMRGMNIIEKLREILDTDIYARKDKKLVIQAFQRLKVNVSESVIEFFINFSGPFWEETLGMELLDIVEDDVNIEVMTNECRKEHSFPNQFLVLTEMCANEIIVLNTINDKVYRVDFEGGHEDLVNGKLDEEWSSFEEFLIDYFDL